MEVALFILTDGEMVQTARLEYTEANEALALQEQIVQTNQGNVAWVVYFNTL